MLEKLENRPFENYAGKAGKQTFFENYAGKAGKQVKEDKTKAHCSVCRKTI